ncbi:MAG: gliding motility-associated ABC transporter substrate-binding protein GldG [Flavobacteriales bacterium]|nr:MAG: gliding motility-associated ABC transporter substrate-binding protein GldG [Flavobacteriales bacterium]
MKKLSVSVIVALAVLLLINFLSKQFYYRFDLTEDGRYTLSKTTKNIVDSLNENAVITVYLEGDFPAEFKRLQTETRQHLEELAALSNRIKFRFTNPLEISDTLIAQGMQPSRLSVQEGGKVSEAIIFPWAQLRYKNKTENINLLADGQPQSQEQQLEKSIENLEYVFSDALLKITQTNPPKIAVLKGNGELPDIKLAGLLTNLQPYYKLAPFTLDSVAVNPQSTLHQLLDYDLALIAKPQKLFTEEEKFTIDQFILNGGKAIFMIDQVTAELDSLYKTGESLAFNKDLNLTDLLFNYGVRINYNLVKDIYSTTIRLQDGTLGNQAQYKDYPWHYYPFVNPNPNHPITKNVAPVRFMFTSSMDTLKNATVKKTVLLQSSKFSKAVGTPTLFSLEDVGKTPIKEDYNRGHQPLAILLEGTFKSAYANRIKPFKTNLYKDEIVNKMLIVSDGDIAANEIVRGQPIPLGIDKYTNINYGNATFLLNSINYLLDDTGLMQLRNKSVQIQFLDKKKAYAERSFWQIINVALPLFILLIFGLVFSFLRKKKYG